MQPLARRLDEFAVHGQNVDVTPESADVDGDRLQKPGPPALRPDVHRGGRQAVGRHALSRANSYKNCELVKTARTDDAWAELASVPRGRDVCVKVLKKNKCPSSTCMYRFPFAGRSCFFRFSGYRAVEHSKLQRLVGGCVVFFHLHIKSVIVRYLRVIPTPSPNASEGLSLISFILL